MIAFRSSCFQRIGDGARPCLANPPVVEDGEDSPEEDDRRTFNAVLASGEGRRPVYAVTPNYRSVTDALREAGPHR